VWSADGNESVKMLIYNSLLMTLDCLSIHGRGVAEFYLQIRINSSDADRTSAGLTSSAYRLGKKNVGGDSGNIPHVSLMKINFFFQPLVG